MSQKILLYGSPTCAMVPPVRSMLERAEAHYEYVDISRNSQERERVREINQGYESVPTLLFSDGSALTEPSLNELRAKLEKLGYDVRPPTWREWIELIVGNPMIRLAAIILLVWGLVNGNVSFIVIGLVILALGFVMGWRKR